MDYSFHMAVTSWDDKVGPTRSCFLPSCRVRRMDAVMHVFASLAHDVSIWCSLGPVNSSEEKRAT